jgi:hypothetical protein
MHRRPTIKFRPGLERLEKKDLPSSGGVTALVASHEARAHASAHSPADFESSGGSTPVISPRRTSLPKRFLGYRITNPTDGFKVKLYPPFQQVLVQGTQPVPGERYNIMYVAVQNGTSQTFTSSSGLSVRLTNQTRASAYPILTGNQEWKPNQFLVFYVLTNKYYPVNQVRGGFQFDLGGASTTLVPGPSALFQRITYNPATFAKQLDYIVAYGQGAQNGVGPLFGMPDTAINRLIAANANRIDYGGRF